MRPIRSQILGAALTGLFFFSPLFSRLFFEGEKREEGKRHETIRSRAKRGRTLKGGKKKRVEEGEISRRGIFQARRGRRGKKARYIYWLADHTSEAVYVRTICQGEAASPQLSSLFLLFPLPSPKSFFRLPSRFVFFFFFVGCWRCVI